MALDRPLASVRVVALLLLIAPLGSACKHSLATPSGRHDLNGQFDGAFSDDLVSEVLSTLWSWKLTQVHESVYGTVAATQSGGGLFNGTLTGTLSGDYLYFTVKIPESGIVDPEIGDSTCSITLSGSATVSQMAGSLPRTVMSGTYSGTRSCGAEIRNGTFLVTRTNESS
jgi:hypothetical protein